MGPVHSEIIIMKAFIFATILAVATAIPIEDTEEVKAAKAEHAAAHAAAEARVLGEPVASAYLADLPEVTEAKAAFQAVFDAYTAGEIPLPVAPVHVVNPIVAAPAVAPYWHGAYPYSPPTIAAAPAKAE